MRPMKTTYKIISIIVAVILIPMSSCNDITEQNVSPNSPQEISSGFILTYVLTEFSKTYNRLGEDAENISGAMQYTQRGTDFNALRVNSYDWSDESWSYYYHLLRNVDIIYEKAVENEHPFFEGVALVLKSLIFGTITDLYGDAPYSESLHANEGIYFPKYDEQKNIYKGILEDLKTADARLAGVNISETPISESADVIYRGDPDRWRRFANSLRLRYCMRLYNKRDEMNAIGVNIVNEFNAASTFAFETTDDNAVLEFLGISPNNSAPGGPLNSANPGFSNKPCQTLVGKLLTLQDPRLHRWIRPVLRKWDVNVQEETERTVTNMFGESFNVIYTPTSTPDQLDTSLYVGLPPGLAGNIALDYNKGDDINEYPSEENPFISFISPNYMQNANTFVNVQLMTLSEVEFILAQAAHYGGFNVSGSAEDHYKNAIKASFDDYLIDEAIGGFDFDGYYENPDVKLADAPDKLERIMEQKWISHWWGIESWFDWRRTGYPDLQTGPVALFGDKLPLRFMYPAPNQDPAYLQNYNEAVQRLEITPNVPTGQSTDHHYSRMWLLQNTQNPW
jgi:hypothetical protein